MTYRLAVLGGGNMGTALVRGAARGSGWAAPDELVVVEVLPARREVLSEELLGVDVVAVAGRAADRRARCWP